MVYGILGQLKLALLAIKVSSCDLTGWPCTTAGSHHARRAGGGQALHGARRCEGSRTRHW